MNKRLNAASKIFTAFPFRLIGYLTLFQSTIEAGQVGTTAGSITATQRLDSWSSVHPKNQSAARKQY
jgi:hypothetical protein